MAAAEEHSYLRNLGARYTMTRFRFSKGKCRLRPRPVCVWDRFTAVLLARRLRFGSTALFALFLLSVPACAQKNPPGPQYTFRKHVREVLTDVTVTDAKGNPVTGLPESAFRVYDDGHPQTIDSFAAHSGSDRAVLSSSIAPGVYSNRYLSHPPAVYNIALLDLTSMTLVEQILLRQQLVHSLQKHPPSAPLAIYMYNGPSIVLVQNFTTSRAALLAAIGRAIPRIRVGDYGDYTDPVLLKQIASMLSQYPGRKNLIWFSGGSNLFLFSSNFPLVNGNNPSLAGSSVINAYNFSPDTTDLPKLPQLYDTLAAERIAVYPIDVRGLRVSYSASIADQEMLMSAEASATGGEAYYETNAIAESARQVLGNSSDFYTLTYSPNDLQHSGRWHKVRIQVDGRYHLSYRRGYYDDDATFSPPSKPLLTVHNKAIQAPYIHSQPILFKAEVQPASAAEIAAASKISRHSRAYTVHYVLPAADFSSSGAHHAHVTVGAAAVVFNDGGLVVGSRIQILTIALDPAQLRAHPHANFAVTQTIAAPKGDNDLYLAVWDAPTGRLGTLQIPLDVKH